MGVGEASLANNLNAVPAPQGAWCGSGDEATGYDIGLLRADGWVQRQGS